METAEQWNWVILAYGFCTTVLVTYVTTIAVRIGRTRKKLGDSS